MSGVVPATSDDFRSVSKAVEASHASWMIFTLNPGFVFSNSAPPLVRKDYDAGTPQEPDARGSFQMLMVTFPPLAPLLLVEDEHAAAVTTSPRAASAAEALR
jgi:hypothetical protein